MINDLELTGWRMRRSVNSLEWGSYCDNLEGLEKIRSKWFDNGWAKSLDYLTSKRTEAEGEDPTFREFYFGHEEGLFLRMALLLKVFDLGGVQESFLRHLFPVIRWKS